MEILRIMDRKRSLTIPLFNSRFQRSPDIGAGEKLKEQELFDQIQGYYDTQKFRDFRNHFISHVDLSANLGPPQIIGDLAKATDLIIRWYSFAATTVIQDAPRYVTVEAAQKGLQQAEGLQRMMIDSLRYQRLNGPPYKTRDYMRYGWGNGEWLEIFAASAHNPSNT
jgi:hypothetical protein